MLTSEYHRAGSAAFLPSPGYEIGQIPTNAEKFRSRFRTLIKSWIAAEIDAPKMRNARRLAGDVAVNAQMDSWATEIAAPKLWAR